MKHSRVGPIVVALGLVVAGCSAAPEPSGGEAAPETIVDATSTSLEPTTTTEPPPDCTPEPPLAVRSVPLLDLLRYVPNEPEFRASIHFVDVAAFNADRGLDVPALGCDDDIRIYGEAAFIGTRIPPVGLVRGTPTEVVQSQLTAWGFSYLDHVAEVEAGPFSEPLRIRALDVPRSDIVDAVASDPQWSDDVTEISDSFFDWGRSMNSDQSSPARPLGRGGALAVADGVVIQGNDADIVGRSLDALATSQGLDTNESFVALATVLDSFDANSIQLSDQYRQEPNVLFSGLDQDGLIDELLIDFPVVPAPNALAIGLTQDRQDRDILLLGFHADSAEQAQVIVDAMRERLRIEIPELGYSWVDELVFLEGWVIEDVAVITMRAEQTILFGILFDDLLLYING